MITRAHIQNFRCLVNVDVTFEPLTILVGPNASGKSALIAAIDPRSGLDDSRNAFRGIGQAMVQVASDHGSLQLRNQLSYIFSPFHLDIDMLRSPNQVQEAPFLTSNGNNFANVVATLTRAEQGELVRAFTALVPMYGDVAVRPSQQGHHRMVFQDRWQPSLWYEPHQVSDGSMLLLAFLTLQYQRTPVDIIAIEEPERGMHPYLVGELIQLLRKLATGKLGPKAIQVILATHSAELLEFVEPSEVRFLSRRDSDGATQVEVAPTDSADWAKAFREYQQSLGAIWLSGSLGGVPGA
jgi:predicted ATPase